MLLLDIHIGHGALVREFQESVLDSTSVICSQQNRMLAMLSSYRREVRGARRDITNLIQFHSVVLRTEFTKKFLCGVAVGAVGFGEDDYSPPPLAI